MPTGGKRKSDLACWFVTHVEIPVYQEALGFRVCNAFSEDLKGLAWEHWSREAAVLATWE